MRQEFERHRFVKNLDTINVLLFKGTAELEETLYMWKTANHVMRYFKDVEQLETEARTSGWLNGFLAGRSTTPNWNSVSRIDKFLFILFLFYFSFLIQWGEWRNLLQGNKKNKNETPWKWVRLYSITRIGLKFLFFFWLLNFFVILKLYFKPTARQLTWTCAG